MLSILFFLIGVLLLQLFSPAALAIGWNDPASLYFIHILTHMFAHANWPHLLGNYLFLFPYGLYLEEKMGKKRFLSCWFISGLTSLLLFRLMNLDSEWGGLIGASGAISGIMAAALLSLDMRWQYRLAAACVLGVRLYVEVFNALYGFSMVAYWGHVGGMIGGSLCVLIWALEDGRVRSTLEKVAARLPRDASRS